MHNIKWRDYWQLCKPSVVALMLLTAWVGMLLAPPAVNGWTAYFFGTIGIAFCAAGAAAINHLVERHIDIHMRRTQNRPLASGRVNPRHAFCFALTLVSLGIITLLYQVNPLTTWLTLLALIGYALFYTLLLKRATPQNIVIGGIAGAAPPLLGWTAVTDQIHPFALLLVLIIFTWTPPHFWALAIFRHQDYAKVKLPMLPITHGIALTKLCILLYIVLLTTTTLLPYLTHMSGLTYLLISCGLNAGFLYYGIRLYRSHDLKVALMTFNYSIVYLFSLFIGLLLDHYINLLNPH